jgi:type VI secretion system VasD/TssJ family lipoprotein
MQWASGRAENQQSRVRATRGRAVAMLAAVPLLAFGLVSCMGGGDDPPEICLAIEASSNLNLFDGQPHVVVLYFYPLQNVMAFQATDMNDLLSGVRPPGMTGDVWETTVLPGEQRELRERLPRDTEYIGVLADFYGKPSRTIVEASCGTFGQDVLVLSASDLQVK